MRRPPQPPLDHRDKPVIWTVSVSRLFDLFRDITLEYDDLATIEPINLARRRRGHIRDAWPERCDAVIAEAPNGAYLKGGCRCPSSSPRRGYDVMQALARARRISPHIGVVTTRTRCRKWPNWPPTFGFQIAQRTTPRGRRAAPDQ